MKRPRCFKCGKRIRAACNTPKAWRKASWAKELAWDMPGGAVSFDGGGNYGSVLYDTMVAGRVVTIVVCDACLKKHRRLLLERTDLHARDPFVSFVYHQGAWRFSHDSSSAALPGIREAWEAYVKQEKKRRKR